MRYLLHITLLFMTNLAFGQLSTSTAMSPNALVQNVLLGPGVQVSNIVFTGSAQAIGQFSYSGTYMGIASGIIMTTGTVFNNEDGPYGPNDAEGAGFDNNSGGSAILNNLIGENTTENATTIQFDFTAVGDFISFNYVFGSEEYPEFVDAEYNDVFGLFISGPGIPGGTQNIAKLPNQAFVNIDNVNENANSAYFVDNGDGNQFPYDANPQYIQYDGYTKVLTASANVQCGQTYHLTIAIADVGDAFYDSGIFLEAQSLTSVAPTNISFQSSENHFGDPMALAEGCTSGEFTFTRTNTEDPLNIPIIISGTATNGQDFSNTIPASLNLAAGQGEATFSFDALGDAITEGSETLIVTFQVPDLCDELQDESFTVTIRDVQPIQVTLANDTINCEDANTITLVPVITGGLEPITYSWSGGQSTPSITVTPTETTTYSVTVTDFCLNSTDTDDAEIFIPSQEPIILQPIADISENCPYITRSFTPQVSGGRGAFTYSWELNGASVGTGSTVQITPAQTGTYDLTVTDACGVTATTSFTYTVETALLIPAINQPDTICPGDSVLLSASATLGYGEYSYKWSHTGITSPNVWVTPLKTTSYTVTISDACQTYSVPVSTVVPVYVPNVGFTFNSAGLEVNKEVQFINTTVNGVSYAWDLGNGENSTLKNPTAVYPDMGEYVVTLIAVDNIGCIDTVSKVLMIGSTIYIPNAFTPDGNRFNNDFEPVGYNVEFLSFEIYNRWGELIFENTTPGRFSWDGTYLGRPVPDGVYTYKVRYKKPDGEELIKIGHVTLLR